MTQTVVSILGLGLTILGLLFGYMNWRTKELRKDEILLWSNDGIDILQRTHQIISRAASGHQLADFEPALAELGLRSSVQVERGRLFFRNIKNEWGLHKPSAYQGLRPIILDCLVANCQICERATRSSTVELQILERLSLQYSRRFVSLAQAEVGRSRRSQSPAEDAGHHIDVETDVRAESLKQINRV